MCDCIAEMARKKEIRQMDNKSMFELFMECQDAKEEEKQDGCQ